MDHYVYLDNSATTKISDRVLQAMLPYLTEHYGNPSSIYAMGRESAQAIEDARAKVAAAFNAKSVGVSESLAVLLPQVIRKAQALGVIMALVFNLPCTMTVAATYRENHSAKWIALSIGYYVAFSLAISCVFYHIGLLIW